MLPVRHRRPSLPRIEGLEDRTLPSASPLVREVTVMSRNLYLGANLDPVIVALSQGQDAPGEVWANVENTRFLERAEALADEIARNRPHLVGLQEAVLWRVGAYRDPAPAEDVRYDFLQSLLDELNERGLHYAPAAVSTNGGVEAPADTDPEPMDVRLIDRDVILARTDLPPSEFEVSRAQTGHFAHNLVLPLPTGPFTVRRGWTTVDATLFGRAFRFVNTHLEAESLFVDINPLQVAQARELLEGPGDTALPTIFLGDFNSRADGTGTDTYRLLTETGFTDAWAVTHPGEPGNTFGDAEDLRNTTVNMDQRIDLVLFGGDAAALRVDLVGEEPADRTPSGLWPSDHAGLVATLRIHVPPTVESVVVNDGSPQRSMVNRLTVTFSEVVTLQVGALEVIRHGGGSVGIWVVPAEEGGRTVAVVTLVGGDVLGGSLADGRYELIIHYDKLHDRDGNRLDGDGDGDAGGDREESFFRLFGDGDGDGDVDGADWDAFRGTWTEETGSPDFLWYLDFDGNGLIDALDKREFKARRGTALRI